MKFPYSISDFYKIITQDYFYVDRTSHIREIEEYGESLLFLRPRRFGKSLLLSMLENYYDVNKADEFERLFGHLAIGQNPTAKHNQYLIMRWDFSAIVSQDDLAGIKRVLYDHINARLTIFAEDYEAILDDSIIINPDNAIASFESTMGAVRRSPYRVYLLIDEYDNLANSILMSEHMASRQRYEELVKGEGVLKTVFNAVKLATSGFGLDRTFITGVSPIVMSDMTSGYNIAKQISLEPAFDDCCGFREAEILSTLQVIIESCTLPEETTNEALSMMRTFYDGYAFSYLSGVRAEIYNPTLALYFLDHFQRHCRSPRRMLDGNFAMDRAKIAYVAGLPGGEQLITAVLQEKESLAIYQLEDRFGVAEMLNQDQDEDFFASLLYYLGVLTLSRIDESGQLILKIPNLVVRKLYVEHLQRSFLPGSERTVAKKVAEIFYRTGNMQPLADFIEQRYFKIFDNRDYKSANELTLKTIFLTVLFNDTAYIMDSELALQRTYTDFTMIVRPDMRQYQLFDILIELKFLKLSEAELSGLEAQKKSRQEVLALKKVKKAMDAAITQVKEYQIRLLAKYGRTLKLRTYAVVALGFEKVVWQEVPPPKSTITHLGIKTKS